MLKGQLDRVLEYLKSDDRFVNVRVVDRHVDNEHGGPSIICTSHRVPQLGGRQYTNHYKFDKKFHVQSLVTSAEFNGVVSAYETKATLGLFTSIEDVANPQGKRNKLS